MNNSGNDKWLDNVLSKTISTENIRPNFKQWKKKYPDAVENIKSLAHRKSIPKCAIDIRKIIMKNFIMKLTTAAVIFLAVILSVIFLDWRVTPAWAIEQTIEVLNNMRMVHFSGYVSYPDQPKQAFEIWAMPNSSDHSISGNFRLVEGDNHIAIANEKKNLTYVYTKLHEGNILYITEGLNRVCNPFPSGDLFRQFKQIGENWKEIYVKNEKTGRESVIVTLIGPAVNTARYWKLEFDVETKIPVRAGVWFNENYKGDPHFSYTSFEYSDEESEKLFQFEIPQDTQIVDCRKLRNLLDENPNYGILIEDMNTSDACKKVVQEYWQAVIDNNWERIQKLRPLVSENSLEKLNEPVELLEISDMNHLDDPGTFAEVTCVIKIKDGTTKKNILNVELRQTTSGRIGVVAGSIGPE